MCILTLLTGDPSVFGNLPVHPVISDAVVNSLRSQKNNGYAPSVGMYLNLLSLSRCILSLEFF